MKQHVQRLMEQALLALARCGHRRRSGGPRLGGPLESYDFHGCELLQSIVERRGTLSGRWRHRHFVDTPLLAPSKHLIKVEGVQHNDSLADD